MNWRDMSETQRFHTLRNMETYGGGFVQRLADAWFAADSVNAMKLAEAFPELIEKYRNKEDQRA